MEYFKIHARFFPLIKLNKRSSELININIYDALGKSVFHGATADEQYQINIRNWNSGIYFCRVEVAGKYVMKKIVKGKTVI